MSSSSSYPDTGTVSTLRLRLEALTAIERWPHRSARAARLRLRHVTTVANVQSGRCDTAEAALEFAAILAEATHCPEAPER